MKRNQWKQENIRLGTHGEDYGSWMSNPVFYIIGGIMEQVHRGVLSHLDYDGQEKILDFMSLFSVCCLPSSQSHLWFC